MNLKEKQLNYLIKVNGPETPTGVLTHTFHEQIIKWAKQRNSLMAQEINKHNPDKRCWSPEEYELVCQVLFGESIPLCIY